MLDYHQPKFVFGFSSQYIFRLKHMYELLNYEPKTKSFILRVTPMLTQQSQPICQLQNWKKVGCYSIPLKPKGRSIHLTQARISPPAAWEESMNAIAGLPVIQVDHLPNSPPPDCHDSEQRKPLRLQALHLYQQVCHPSDHETD